MLQKKTQSDYVVSTGKQYTVKEFVNLVLEELNFKFSWKGKGINEKGYDQEGNCIIECKKKYFRPLDVDTLIGDAKKAKKMLKWKAKVSFLDLVKEMVEEDLKKLEGL